MRWTVCYEAVIRVNVEANSLDEAVIAAEKTIGAVAIMRMRLCEITQYSIATIDKEPTSD